MPGLGRQAIAHHLPPLGIFSQWVTPWYELPTRGGLVALRRSDAVYHKKA